MERFAAKVRLNSNGWKKGRRRNGRACRCSIKKRDSLEITSTSRDGLSGKEIRLPPMEACNASVEYWPIKLNRDGDCSHLPSAIERVHLAPILN